MSKCSLLLYANCNPEIEGSDILRFWAYPVKFFMSLHNVVLQTVLAANVLVSIVISVNERVTLHWSYLLGLRYVGLTRISADV